MSEHWDIIQEIKDIMAVMVDKLNEGLELGVAVEFNITQREKWVKPDPKVKPIPGVEPPKEYFLSAFKVDLTKSIGS